MTQPWIIAGCFFCLPQRATSIHHPTREVGKHPTRLSLPESTSVAGLEAPPGILPCVWLELARLAGNRQGVSACVRRASSEFRESVERKAVARVIGNATFVSVPVWPISAHLNHSQPAIFFSLLCARCCWWRVSGEKLLLVLCNELLTHEFAATSLLCFSSSPHHPPATHTIEYGNQTGHAPGLECLEVTVEKKTVDITPFLHNFSRSCPFTTQLQVTKIQSWSVEEARDNICCAGTKCETDPESGLQPRLPQK